MSHAIVECPACMCRVKVSETQQVRGFKCPKCGYRVAGQTAQEPEPPRPVESPVETAFDFSSETEGDGSLDFATEKSERVGRAPVGGQSRVWSVLGKLLIVLGSELYKLFIGIGIVILLLIYLLFFHDGGIWVTRIRR